MNKRILFISGSLGMGHITRDLAIAAALREYIPGVEIVWLAAHPANLALKEAGESLLPEPYLWEDETLAAEQASDRFKLNLIKYTLRVKEAWRKHIKVFFRLISNEPFDLIIGDETYELVIYIKEKKINLPVPFVMINDFIGLDAMGHNPLEILGVYGKNRGWSEDPPSCLSYLFVGQLEDVPDKSFGWFLPNRRQWAQRNCRMLGYILRFQPDEFKNKKELRRQLGYDDSPLVVCSIGGTAIGKYLLELCGRAYPLLKEKAPNLKMALVCGPRLDPKSVPAPPEVDVLGYVPELYKYFAASDLAIVQAGATTTIELTALGVPFIYFPLEGQYEQEVLTAQRMERHRAGVKMTLSRTSPEKLAEKAFPLLGKKVDYAAIPVDGARRAAEIIRDMLQKAGQLQS